MIFRDNFCGYDKYTISSDKLCVSVITLGATVTSLKYLGRETVLNYPDAQGYLDGTAFICASIGRYANRIGGSCFSLNGKEHKLPANEGNNQLHGGPNSYDKRTWKAEAGENSVFFSLFSPDGDNGFPGNLTATVCYTVEGSRLRIDYGGVCDADTVYAPTTHFYFNLDGSDSILDAGLRISADKYVAVGEGLIPTGELPPVDGDFDFRTLRPVTRNYDHCFILSDAHGCTVEAGGITLDMYTDFPAVQIYTSECLGAPHKINQGLAIEPEFYPDSPNHPEFPSTVLKKGESFHKYAEFVFSGD